MTPYNAAAHAKEAWLFTGALPLYVETAGAVLALPHCQAGIPGTKHSTWRRTVVKSRGACSSAVAAADTAEATSPLVNASKDMLLCILYANADGACCNASL